MYLAIIRNLLQLKLDDIDSGNSNISEKELEQIINLFQTINNQELSKIESCNYILKSRASFDNYVAKGLLPKGHKRPGINTLFWNKKDLDKFIKNNNERKTIH